jgi:membrane protease YdiL (CAAX protease family)
MTTHPAAVARPAGSVNTGGAVRRFARRRPIAAFAVGAFGLGWPLLTVITTTTFARQPLGVAFTYVALLGSALAASRLADGPGAAGRLLARLAIWRFGVGRWAMIVLGMPVLTLAVAAVSGPLQTPACGWVAAAGHYLFQTFIYGALFVNLAEETAWSGFVQTRFTQRHGLLIGALLTTPFFVAIHLPLQFAPGWTWGGVGVGVAVLAIIAPFFRYLMGDHLLATGGSLLAVGVQHAAFNASGDLVAGSGGWQFLPALVVLVLIVAVTRRLRSRPARSVADSAARRNNVELGTDGPTVIVVEVDGSPVTVVP